MRVALDASCLMVNPCSGLAEVARNLASHLPVDAEHDEFALFINYFRGSVPITDLSSFDLATHVLRLPRRIVEWWWGMNWPPIDLYLRGVDVFHGLHVQIPPTKKMKTVLTVHDCRYMAFPDMYSESEVQSYRSQMTRSLSRVDQVVTDSEFTRQELLSYFSLPEERVRVIHCGISPWTPSADDWEAKSDQFITETKIPQPYLLYLGVLDPRKNLKNLLEALARCKATTPDFPHLLVVGIERPQWDNSEEACLANELGLSGNIHVTGVIDKDLVWALIKKALALCYPSLYEGFGLPPLEAMSVGVPVLAGRAASIPEITGNAACLVNPLDIEEITAGLTKIVGDSDYRKNLIELGFQQTAKFSWNKTAEQYVSIYHEVAGS